MKIPIYQSQASLTRETPGRSISARQSMSGPRAIAEQGNVLTAALSEVNSFATMRYKMIDETQRNEAIFGAKTSIRDVAARFAREDNLNTMQSFFEGGQNSPWNQEMSAIRERLTENLNGSKASQAMFDEEFKIASSNAKFQLTEKLQDRLEERHKASLNQELMIL